MRLVIDGNYIAYRTFHKSPPLTNSTGFPTAVIHGFLQFLISIQDRLKPEETIVVFDAKGKTWRDELVEDYKATRERMPEDMIPQLEALRELIPMMGIPMLSVEGYEADDVMFTLTDTEMEVYLATKDKDLHQLAAKRVKLYDPSAHEPIDEGKVEEKFGIPPSKILDMLALAGDTSDNIPGVQGVGPKTAVKLLLEHGDLDGVYENIDSIKGKLKEKLENDKEKAYLSRDLATLRRVEDLKIPSPDKDDDALASKLSELELRTIQERLFGEVKESESLSEGDVEKPAITVCINGSFYAADDKHYTETKAPEATEKCYDIKNIYRKTGEIPEGVRDLMLISWMNDPDGGGLRPQKDEPAGEFVTKCLNSFKAEERSLSDNDLNELYETLELPIARILAEMEHKGIRLEAEKLEEVTNRLEKELEELKSSLTDTVGHDINLNSPKQLSAFLFDELGIKPTKKTKTGYSTSEEALREMKAYNPDHTETIDNILHYRELNKLVSTYTKPLIDYISKDTGRVHTEFKQTGTATGRLSSNHPNMQNIPQKGEHAKAIRSAFTPEDGYVFASFDYSQIELRILAHLTGDETLIKAYKEGLDIHTQTASLVFGMDEEDVDSNSRRLAKAVNFGIIYGLSAYGLSRDTGVSPKEAQKFIDRYFEKYSGVKDFIAKTTESTKKNGYAETILGRKRFITDIQSRNRTVAMRGERVATNTRMQGSAADIIKLAMLRCDEYIKEEELDAHLVLQLHDELVFEVNSDLADKFEEKIISIMESVIELDVPLVVNGSTEKNLGELK
ncbi:DNA polymerase [Limisalsivibrio acetivorans]|uniref:DNA polymerase n=1 Tax=Limisalsivibrio acetivorans TaxID=1304888 RepID=UPI0003B6FD3E|nr:DNA polymerase [Limisalsivibrio acetivorans]